MLSELFSTCLTTVAAKSSSWVSEELLVWLPKCGRCSSCGLPSDGAISALWSPVAFSDLILGEEEEGEEEWKEEEEEEEEERPVTTVQSRKKGLCCHGHYTPFLTPSVHNNN